MSRRPSTRRPLAVGAVALLAVGTAATGASAQSTEIGVSAAASAGSRQFFVEDLTGSALTAIDLGRTGQGPLFQTRVKDLDFASPNAGFTASAEMTNLYREDGSVDYATKVDSADLRVDFAALPTDVAGVSLAAVPTIRVSGVLPRCGELPSLLPSGSALLDSNPLTGLLSGLSNAASPLCNALGGVLGLTGPTVDTVDGVLVELQEQVLSPALDQAGGLPLSLLDENGGAATEAGTFDNPSYLGVGEDDPNKTQTAATARKVLAGSPNSALDLEGLLSPSLDGKPLFPAVPGGSGALTTVSAVVAAMQASTDSAVAQVGNALAGLSAADQTGILSGLDPVNGSTPVASLVDSVLDRISGTYRSFPRLTADLSGAPAGDYTGTLTITFVQR